MSCYYNNVCLPFADIIPCAVTAGVLPKLTWAHEHTVPTSAFIWFKRGPVCIVQGCPIAPLPGSLYTQQCFVYTYNTDLKYNNQPQRKKTQYMYSK